MWNLKNEAELVLQQIKDLGIYIYPIKSYIVNERRNSKTWGLCKKVGENEFEIQINWRLLSGDVDITILRSVLAHEILHAAPDCFNHGKNWKRLGRMVEDKLGYRIQTHIIPEHWDEVKSNEVLKRDLGETRAIVPKGFELNVGDHIRHKSWGDGFVMAISPVGSDAVLSINFQCGGIRRLMLKASAAQIEIITKGLRSDYQ